jgi:hypothetical protein
MRMLMRVTCDIDKGNEAIKSGTMGEIIERAAKDMKPEAMYFTTDKGERTGYFFFDMKDSHQLAPIAEPFLLNLNANVEVMPVMNIEDLKMGLSKVKL